MSGIIGKLSFDRQEPLARPILDQMLEKVRLRGDEASGIYAAPGIALGWSGQVHGSREALPLTECRHVRVAADAHLTNAPQLRVALERHGHVFHQRSDCEVIAHAYEQWGDRCVESFEGPFACAIWDQRHCRLLLARDHIGIRPLYFAVLPGHGVVFASRIPALLQDPGVGREWCPGAIDAYLALGYVPAPLTVYQRISKLEPAQRLVVDGRRLHVEQYWDLPAPARWRSTSATAADVSRGLGAAMHAGVNTGLVNGTLYSGGLASTAFLTAAPEAAGRVVMVALDQDAAAVSRGHHAAQHLGHDPVLEVASPDAPLLASELAAHFDEPLADPGAVSLYAVCSAARGHADSLFGGHGAATLWGGSAPPTRERAEDGVRIWLRGGRDDDHRRAIYTRGFAWQVRDLNPFARHLDLYAARDTGWEADRARYVEARTWLPDDALAIAERAALAAGTRLWFPYLHRGMVELAASAPPSLEPPMRPVRELLSWRLPPALVPLPHSSSPRHPWLRPALAAMVPGVLLAQRFDGRGIVSRSALRQLWEEHRSGRRDHSHRLWALLMLEFWFRHSIDGDAAEEPLEYELLRAA